MQYADSVYALAGVAKDMCFLDSHPSSHPPSRARQNSQFFWDGGAIRRVKKFYAGIRIQIS
jgi:hypothetical protein